MQESSREGVSFVGKCYPPTKRLMACYEEFEYYDAVNISNTTDDK
jgi:hypothetical protein